MAKGSCFQCTSWVNIGWILFGNDPSAGSPTERIQHQRQGRARFKTIKWQQAQCLPLQLSVTGISSCTSSRRDPLSGVDRLDLRQCVCYSQNTHHPLPYSQCAFYPAGSLVADCPCWLLRTALSRRLLPSNGHYPSAALAVFSCSS